MAFDEARDALDELREEAMLPPPGRMRDLILHSEHDPAQAFELNREFQSYLKEYGALEKRAARLLAALAAAKPKNRATSA
jgi:hypothetical protein